jgi:hypothetical protein
MIVGKFLHRNFSRSWGGAGGGGVQVKDWLGSGDRNLHAIVLQLMWQVGKKNTHTHTHFNKVESSCYFLHNIVQFMHL